MVISYRMGRKMKLVLWNVLNKSKTIITNEIIFKKIIYCLTKSTVLFDVIGKKQKNTVLMWPTSNIIKAWAIIGSNNWVSLSSIFWHSHAFGRISQGDLYSKLIVINIILMSHLCNNLSHVNTNCLCTMEKTTYLFAVRNLQGNSFFKRTRFRLPSLKCWVKKIAIEDSLTIFLQ